MNNPLQKLVSFEEDHDYRAIVRRVFRLAIEHPLLAEELKGKAPLGGYLCIARQEDGFPLFITQFGEMAVPRLAKRFEYCQEKDKRLAFHPSDNTSYESRNEKAEQYGGAVRGKKYLWAISGLPEQLDELLSALAAIEAGDLDLDDARAMLAANENEFFLRFRLPHPLWE